MIVEKGDNMKIIGIVGSLRAGSFNRKLLHLVKDLVPEEVELIDLDYKDIPVFNEDTEFPAPKGVEEIRQEIKEADGVFFFVPEYNQGISGALKNLIDWISRPVSFETMEKVLVHKPAAMMGATLGVGGSITAQENLRSYLAFMNVPVMPQPRANISQVNRFIDEQGNMTLDQVTLDFVRQTALGFVEYIKLHQK